MLKSKYLLDTLTIEKFVIKILVFLYLLLASFQEFTSKLVVVFIMKFITSERLSNS